MSIWKKLYQAYEEGNCEKFKEYRSQLTEDDKKTPYFLYYEKLRVKLCKEQVKSKILLKGKVIKCPSCGTPLTLTEYNKLQIKKLRYGVSQVVFVCGYCGNEFKYSRKPFKTIFSGYKIGQDVELNGRKYKLAGAIRYEGIYKEGTEGGSLEYIEWTAYDKNGDIYYISESRAKDNWGIYDEFEVSQKVNFPFLIQGINQNEILTNKNDYNIDEYDEVEVKSVIGQVNKGYKIGEKVRLWKFGDYNLEEEKGKNTVERNLYSNLKQIKTKKILQILNYKNDKRYYEMSFKDYLKIPINLICGEKCNKINFSDLSKEEKVIYVLVYILSVVNASFLAILTIVAIITEGIGIILLIFPGMIIFSSDEKKEISPEKILISCLLRNIYLLVYFLGLAYLFYQLIKNLHSNSSSSFWSSSSSSSSYSSWGFSSYGGGK